MKALFKLKGKCPTPKYSLMLSREDAEIAYVHGSYHDIDLPVYNSNGFRIKYLTFSEWINRHKIGIL